MARKLRQFGTGSLRQLPSGRWQARLPGGREAAPTTFDTKLDASAWLKDHLHGEAIPEIRPTFRLRDYAETWLAGRDLRAATRSQYDRYLKSAILPVFGDTLLGNVSPSRVRAWYDKLDPAEPTRRRRIYGLFHAIMATAVADDLIDSNPCRLRAGKAVRKHRIKVATLPELTKIVESVPSRYKALILLAAWCGLRFGELTELRRRDVDLATGVLQVDRAWILVDGEHIIGDPKTEAGKRTVHVPPHLIPSLKVHLRKHVGRSGDALLFPAAHGDGHMLRSTLYKVWDRARKEAGRPDLRFHDLRHTGATLAAATGATLADLMARLGHSTPGAAMIYQHSVSDRDKAIAAALSAMVSTAGASSPPGP